MKLVILYRALSICVFSQAFQRRGSQEEMAGRDRKYRYENTRTGVSMFATFSTELFRGLDLEGRCNTNLGLETGRFDIERGDREEPIIATIKKAIILKRRQTDHSKVRINIQRNRRRSPSYSRN